LIGVEHIEKYIFHVEFVKFRWKRYCTFRFVPTYK
jgi:hypothetical protein